MSTPSWYKRILEHGATGPDVEIVRRKLGLGPGVYDSEVERMVLALARKSKVASDGEVNKDVAEVIGQTAADEAGLLPGWYAGPVVMMFQEGEDIRALRGRLGLGTNDNRYDADAEAAVRRIQSGAGVRVDGLVTEETAKLIG